VVTGQDYLRYEDTIEVVPADGSYIVVDSYTPNATPVNQQTSLSVNFKNVGLDATSGTTSVTINSTDDRLTIITEQVNLVHWAAIKSFRWKTNSASSLHKMFPTIQNSTSMSP
jgi:hypothetical protein